MAGITLADAETQLAAWLKASHAVSMGQSYSITTDTTARSLTRVHAKEILDQVTFWDHQVKRLSGNRRRLSYARVCYE
jgi:hypothetical protein